ncbi:hypothetical protein LBMAG27_09910 [Bacteroidota bacterium]|nr:hypothetical protein LBMAG27_09910 [Bacteroidota bacterium]
MKNDKVLFENLVFNDENTFKKCIAVNVICLMLCARAIDDEDVLVTFAEIYFRKC